MVTPPLHARSLDDSRWAHAKWLIIAPHADDEILGCAALIGTASARRGLAAIAFLTDSAGSHPCESDLDRRKLAALRRHEAGAAIRIMTKSAPSPLFLNWPDARPYPQGSLAFEATVTRLATLCDQARVDAIAVTGRHEPHCDHVAAFEVAAATANQALRPTRLFEYAVWTPHAPGRDFLALKTAPVSIGRRQAALAQHRSQMTPSAGQGFQVPHAMRRMPACDVLYTQNS